MLIPNCTLWYIVTICYQDIFSLVHMVHFEFLETKSFNLAHMVHLKIWTITMFLGLYNLPELCNLYIWYIVWKSWVRPLSLYVWYIPWNVLISHCTNGNIVRVRYQEICICTYGTFWELRKETLMLICTYATFYYLKYWRVNFSYYNCYKYSYNESLILLRALL